MDDKVTSIMESILSNIGGKGNISSFEHCITRLRINVLDMDKVSIEGLQEIEEVMAVINLDNQIQVVLGPRLASKLGDKIEDELNYKIKNIRVKYKLVNILRDIGYIFAPIIPGLIGSGLIISMLNIILYFELLVGSDIIKYLDLLSRSVYEYMPIFVGVSGAKYYGLSYIIGGIIGGLGNIMDFNVSLIALIFIIKILSLIEKKLRTRISDYLETMVSPLILLLVGLLLLRIFNGFAIYIFAGIEDLIFYLMNINKIFTGFIMGASFLPLISLGLHHSLLPLNIQIMESGLNQIWPILVMAGAGQIGVSSSIYFNVKDRKLKKEIGRGLIYGFLGIGEVLVYKVTKVKGDRFIISCIAAGIGGGIISYFEVASRSLVLAGWPLLLSIEVGKMRFYILGLFTSYISGYIIMTIKSYWDRLSS